MDDEATPEFNLDYYRKRAQELESARDIAIKESRYYQTELVKAHELLGRVIHQTSERWDTVRLSKYFPTDNLFGKRNLKNPDGK